MHGFCQKLQKFSPVLSAPILTSCHAVAVLHEADFVTRVDRSAPVEWLAATFGPKHAIALLLIAVIALAGTLIRVLRRQRSRDLTRRSGGGAAPPQAPRHSEFHISVKYKRQ